MSSITAGTTSTTTLVHSGDTTGSLVFKTNDTGSGGTTAVTLDTNQNATFAGKVTSAGALTLASNGTTTAVTIDTSQNVGIGTTSPSSKFSVGTASYGQQPCVAQVNGTSLAIANNAGIFNIGCTDAAAADVGGSLGFTANGGVNGYSTGQISGRRESATSSVYSSYMAFSTTASNSVIAERMRINSSGYLLVGCTALPSSSVAGASLSPSVTSVNPHFFSAGSATGSVAQINFINGNGTVGQISTSGSGTTYSTSSDYRLKNNIAPMAGALAKVQALKPVTYKWNADNSDGEGFIAHELQAIVPDAVTGEKDAVDADGNPVYQGIDTSFLVATLTAAIQELKAINDQQAETINALTARVVALEGQ